MGERVLLPDEPESVTFAKMAVRAIGGSGRKLWKREEEIVADMPPDSPELIGYLMDRRQAEKEDCLAQFIVDHLASNNPVRPAEFHSNGKQTE